MEKSEQKKAKKQEAPKAWTLIFYKALFINFCDF